MHIACKSSYLMQRDDTHITTLSRPTRCGNSLKDTLILYHLSRKKKHRTQTHSWLKHHRRHTTITLLCQSPLYKIWFRRRHYSKLSFEARSKNCKLNYAWAKTKMSIWKKKFGCFSNELSLSPQCRTESESKFVKPERRIWSWSKKFGCSRELMKRCKTK